MTAVVGIIAGKKVWMGGDAAATCSSTLSQTLVRDPKVFISGEMLYGFSGSFRMGQLLRFNFNAPEHPDDMDDTTYLHTIWVDSLRECLKEGGFTKIEDSIETAPECSLLIGYRGKLYIMESDFNILEPAHPYAAIGSSGDFSLGALSALFRSGKRLSPRKKIEITLLAASDLSASCRPPFTIKSI